MFSMVLMTVQLAVHFLNIRGINATVATVACSSLCVYCPRLKTVALTLAVWVAFLITGLTL